MYKNRVTPILEFYVYTNNIKSAITYAVIFEKHVIYASYECDIEMKPYHPSKKIVSNYLQNWYRYKPNEAIKASKT